MLNGMDTAAKMQAINDMTEAELDQFLAEGTGKEVNIFAEVLEVGAKRQMAEVMVQPCVVRGALMADAHTGYSMPIGGVAALDGHINPLYVGFDIGCGMVGAKLSFDRDLVQNNAKAIYDEIYKRVPVGFSHNQHPSVWDHSHLKQSAVLKEIFDYNSLLQLGSMGGGNHFIEVGAAEDDSVWVIVHSGSRGVGNKVAQHYIREARIANGADPDDKKDTAHYALDVTTQVGKDYITDMDFCLEMALASRKEMANRVVAAITHCTGVEGGIVELINKNHNHAELGSDGLWVHRKGATHADEGMPGVIPGNMRDGTFIVEGLGSASSLHSSSHGAGRVLSRKKARENIDLADFEATMKEAGVVASVDQKRVDESPFAYKSIFDVMRIQEEQGLLKIRHHVRPILNVKG